MPLSKELVRAVRSRVEGEPDVSTRLLAAELGASQAQVITALPVAMRTRAKVEDCPHIWQELCCIPGMRVGVIAACASQNDAAGAMPPVQADRIGSIWFMAATQTREPAVYFLDKQGGLLVEALLPREAESGAFAMLKKKHGVQPLPKNRCKGCKQCTCHLEERPAA